MIGNSVPAVVDDYDEERFGNFRWLRRASRASTYNSFSEFKHNPACSFEWGENGYAGCTNYGGELLYLSAPSLEHGLMAARGTYSASTYATLSRTQVEFGGSSTFGLEIALAECAYDPQKPETKEKGSSFKLGDMVERGCFNYRWPFNEYYLDLFESQNDIGRMQNNRPIHVGRCQMFSCAKGGTFYQVLRIEEVDQTKTSNPRQKFPSSSQVVLTIGGPVWFRYLGGDLNLTPEQKDAESEVEDKSTPAQGTSRTTNRRTTIRFWDEKRGVGLEVQVYQGNTNSTTGQYEYKILEMVESESDWDSGTSKTRQDFQAKTVRAYNTIVPLHNATSATFLATIRFIPDSSPWPVLPNPKEMYEYVGVSPSSPDATGAMWKTVFFERQTGSGFVLSLAEFNLVGRALEKILQVDIIPAFFSDPPGAAMVDAEQGNHATLVSNLFLHPNVDLLSLFWKIRFLVKVHQFLSRLCGSYKEANLPSTNDRYKLIVVAQAQFKRIEDSIQNVIRYLVRALLQPGSRTILMPDNKVPGESNYYYVMMTIWYVCDNFRKRDWKWIGPISSQEGNFFASHRPSDSGTFRSESEKISLLQWYHYGSILKLCEEKILPETWRTDGLGRSLELKVSNLAKIANTAAEAKASSRQPYTAEDEIFDRLAFLSDELGLKPASPNQGPTVASLSMKRVSQRDQTRYLNPGWLSRSHEGSTWGPWEIYALCHHIPLVVFGMGAKVSQELNRKEYAREEIESIKGNVLLFMNGEGTIMPSWERSHSNHNNGLFRSEATAVVASALLMINERDVNDVLNLDYLAVPTESHKQQPSQVTDYQKSILLEISSVKSMIKDQLRAFEKDSQLDPIKWRTFALPFRYHPSSFFNSLGNTPELYQPPLINRVVLPPSVAGHATTPQEMTTVDFDYDHLILLLKYFSVFDIKPIQDPKEGSSWKLVTHKHKDLDLALYKSLVDQEVQHRFLAVRSPHVPPNLLERLYSVIGTLSQRQKIPPEFLDLLRVKSLSWILHRDLLEHIHIQPLNFITNKMTKKDLDFCDNLKDESLGRGIPKPLLDLLVYVIHPESADCLGNHILKYSKYSCDRRKKWVAGITLRSWRVACTGPQPTQAFRTFSDSEPIYLPQYIESVRESGEIAKMTFPPVPLKMLSFELCTSSIVLSTNAFGDFSKCTIVSEFLDNESIGDIADDAQQLWNKFVHQPQTARCLVFLSILKAICQRITENYEDAIKKMSPFLELNNNIDRPEDEPAFSKQTPSGFRLLIWGIDALQKWQVDLESSIDHIQEATKDLMAQIMDGPGNRHPQLQKMCQEHIRGLDFDSTFELLMNANKKLKRTIEFKKNHQQTYFSLKGMEDSHNSLRLQNGVSRLTYLTIVYLPPALIAAIFTIPLEQNLISQNTGLKWFIGSIFILSVGTYFLAFYIQMILDSFSSLIKFFKIFRQKIFRRPSNKKGKPPPQLITSPSSEDDETPSSSLWRKIFEFDKTAEADVEEAKEK